MGKTIFTTLVIIAAILLLSGCKGHPGEPGLMRPIAVPGVENGPYYVDKPVHFFDKGSHDPNSGGKIVKCQWDWNNDRTWDEEGKEVTHTWDSPGTYDVLFRVTDEEGETATIAMPLEVDVQPGDPRNAVDVTPPWLNFSPAGVCVSGNYTYVAGGYSGFHVFDTSDPANPVWVGRTDMVAHANNQGWSGADAVDVTISGQYAYVAERHFGLDVVDISTPGSPQVVGFVDMSRGAKAVALSGGYAYACGYEGVVTIDISNPRSPIPVSGPLKLAHGQNCAAVCGGYLYVTDDAGGLTVIDISSPGSPQTVQRLSCSSHAWGLCMSGNCAYVAAAQEGLVIVDISTPDTPRVINRIPMPGTANSVEISGNFAYVSTGDAGIQIVDISSTNLAHVVKTIATPGSAERMTASGKHAYVADCYVGLDVLDISTVDSAQVIKIVRGLCPPGGVQVSGKYAYLSDNYAGLEVVDISTPELPKVVTNLPPGIRTITLSNGYAYAGLQDGLEVVDISNPAVPRIAKTVKLPGDAQDVAVYGSHAYVALSYGGLAIVDVSTPESSQLVKTIDTPYAALGVAASDGYAYLAENWGLDIVDVSPPETAGIVGNVSPGDSVSFDVAVSGKYAYLGGMPYGLAIIDLSKPDSPKIVKTISDIPVTWGVGIALSGAYAYVCYTTDDDSGLAMLDISTPGSTHLVKTLRMGDVYVPPNSVAVSGEYAYVTDGANGLRVIRLW